MKHMIFKKAMAGALTFSMLMSAPLSGVSAADSAAVTDWKTLYKGLGVDTSQSDEGYYDVVTSATTFSSFHAKDIPSVVSRQTDAQGNTTGLTGVTVQGKDKTKEVKLANASWSSASKYGTEEFDIVPDNKVEGYVWNEYFTNLYAAVVSDGKTTVGAVPWIDLYGEAADASTSPHYNKVQLAFNSGKSTASNKAEVHRYDAFYENGHLKPGTYTVTLYAEGYKDLTTGSITVLPRYAGDVSGISYILSNGAKKIQITGIPEDLKDVRVTVSAGRSTLADKAEVKGGAVDLTGEIEAGSVYTVTITSSNYAPIIRENLAAPVSDAQKAELEKWIDRAKKVNGYAEKEELAKSLKDAEAVLAEAGALSTNAAKALSALMANTKATYDVFKAAVTLKGKDLAITPESGKAAPENAAYRLTSGSGRNIKVLASGAYAEKVKLDTEPELGTEYTLNIISDNYQDFAVKVTAEAADPNGEVVTKKASSVSLAPRTVPYTGKAVSIGAAKVTGSTGKVSYTYYLDPACKNRIQPAEVKGAGVYYVKAFVEADAGWEAAVSSAVKLTIQKAENPMRIKASSKKFKVKKSLKKKKSFKIGAKNAIGKVSYKLSGKAKKAKIKVNAKGKVTVPAKCKKGKYKITVKAAGDKNYLAKKMTVIIILAK